jgi:hypothetical protein
MEKGKRSEGIKGNSYPRNKGRTSGTKQSSYRGNERLKTSFEMTKKQDESEVERNSVHFYCH